MKRFFACFFSLALIFLCFACVKKNHVSYSFKLYNATEGIMTVQLSTWGGYSMSINGIFDSSHQFSEIEEIKPHSDLSFNKQVGDNPDPYRVPGALVPPWGYIKSIKCNGVVIPKDYFTNPQNWDLGVARQLNGTFTFIELIITQELLDEFTGDK